MSLKARTFVAQADLTKLACDIVLVPTDAGLYVTESWRGLGPPPEAPAGWGDRGVRVTEAVPERENTPPRLVRWVNTGNIPARADDVDWLMQGVRQALDAAAQSVRGQEPANKRARPLVGLPLFGIGAGGYGAVRGEVLDRILEACDGAAERHGYDLVIACQKRADYAALQSRRLARGPRDAGLGEELRAQAEWLGGLAKAGQLALFLGAGVGKPAGLPDWDELIGRLAADSGYDADQLKAIPVIDAASLLEDALGDQFRVRLRSELSRPFHALGHSLLASLRAHEVITTNFDRLYEQACEATFDEGDQPRVLPWTRAEPGRPWLLKMHGDVASEHVVLGREAFLGYDARWRPLASLVQAAMMTRHLLFVGYSLKDENFVRLGRDVSLLLKSMELPREVGTVLTLWPEPMLKTLWRQDLRPVSMTPEGTDAASASRVVEVFLDHLAMTAASGERSYLLDSRYEALVEDPDSAVFQRLIALGEAVSAERDGSWPEVTDLLRGLGYRLKRR